MVDSSVAVGGGPTGSSSSSVAEWKLSSSLGGAGESSVVESSQLLSRELGAREVYIHPCVSVSVCVFVCARARCGLARI